MQSLSKKRGEKKDISKDIDLSIAQCQPKGLELCKNYKSVEYQI